MAKRVKARAKHKKNRAAPPRKAVAWDDVRQPELARQDHGLRSRAIALSYDYSRDDGLTIGMLLLPFLMLALAIGITQPFGSKKQSVERQFASIIYPAETRARVVVPRYAMAPRAKTAPPVMVAKAPVEVAPAPAAIPSAAEIVTPPPVAVPSPRAEIALTPPEMVLPPNPPAIVPEPVSPPSPAFALPHSPPVIEQPDIAMLPPPPLATIPAPEASPVPEAATPPVVAVPEPPASAIEPSLPPVVEAPQEPKVCLAPVPPMQTSPAAIPDTPGAFGRALAAAARSQLGELIVYTDAYRKLSYPMGDVPKQFGVCTDVVVRAYRSLGVDLQALVFAARAGQGDPSIDHRRTEVLRRFFAIHGEKLPASPYGEDYQPGDIVTYYRPQNSGSTSHIAIVSDETGPSGNPMIIHNRGWGPQLEDALFVDEMTGHYRYGGPKTARQPVVADIPPLPVQKPKLQRLALKATPLTEKALAPVRVKARARAQSEPPQLRQPGSF